MHRYQALKKYPDFMPILHHINHRENLSDELLRLLTFKVSEEDRFETDSIFTELDNMYNIRYFWDEPEIFISEL